MGLLLAVKNLHAYYEKSHVLKGVQLMIDSGEVVGLLGRNGAGKTTLLKSILGLVQRSGIITFKGKDLTRLDNYKIPRLGIGYVPQDRHIFPRLTVQENIDAAKIQGKLKEEDLENIYMYFPKLRERLFQKGGTLSGGEQQMLSLARALVSQPKLIMLDEPMEGLMPSIVNNVETVIKTVNKKGVTVLYVGQNVGIALDICDRIYILENGNIKFDGDVKKINEDVVLKYIGVVKKG